MNVLNENAAMNGLLLSVKRKDFLHLPFHIFSWYPFQSATEKFTINHGWIHPLVSWDAVFSNLFLIIFRDRDWRFKSCFLGRKLPITWHMISQFFSRLNWQVLSPFSKLSTDWWSSTSSWPSVSSNASNSCPLGHQILTAPKDCEFWELFFIEQTLLLNFMNSLGNEMVGQDRMPILLSMITTMKSTRIWFKIFDLRRHFFSDIRFCLLSIV